MFHWNRKKSNHQTEATNMSENPESRADISRRNGAKSKGPISREGRENSAKNSLKHGLLARTVVLHNESKDRFVRLLRSLQAQFQPATPVERQLVETLAVARWRQLRTWGLEKSAIGYQLRHSTSTTPDLATEDDVTQTTVALRDFTSTSRYLDHISHAETRFDRQYDRALRRLLSLRNRPQADPSGGLGRDAA